MAEVDAEYYDSVLQGIGAPVSKNNLRFLVAWQKAEGGHATYNAFNTTQPEAGTTDYNSVGVKNYPDENTGIVATVKTLLNGHYTNIVNDLKGDSDPTKTAGEVDEISTWGTDPSVIRQALGAQGGSVQIPTKVAPPIPPGSPATGTTSSTPATSGKNTSFVSNQSFTGLATTVGVVGIATLAGATIVVLGLWKTVQPTAERLKDKATSAASTAAQLAPAAAV